MAEKMLHLFKDKPPTLEEAQAIVGGLVEMVPLMNPENMQLIVNEEGLMHDLPVNTQASMIAGRRLVGPAIVLEGDAMWD